MVEGQRVLVWLRMDEIDAYQAPDGLIELSPYLHVDHVPETQQDRRRFRFTISPQSGSPSTYPLPDIWRGLSGDVQGSEEPPARQVGYAPSAMPRKVPHRLVQTHVRRVFNQVLGTAIDHVYGGTHTHALGDMVGIRLVTRVAVPYETEAGQSRHAASSVTMMTLSGKSDKETLLGYNVAWVPTSCIRAERSDDGSLLTWIDMFSPAVRGAFANVGMHYQPTEWYESHLYPLTVQNESLQSADEPIYAMATLVRLPDGDDAGACHQQNRQVIAGAEDNMHMTRFASEAAALCANFDCPDYLVQQERGSMQYHVLVPADRVEAVYEAARDGHGPRQQRGLHYTRDTLWPVAAHELRSTMGATGGANMNWQERVAVFDLKTVTVDSDQRATLADPVRIFADDIERMKQHNLVPLHGTAQAARLSRAPEMPQLWKDWPFRARLPRTEEVSS